MSADSLLDLCGVVGVNSLLAVVLALFVAALCSRIQRPSLRHALWLLVLLRLMVPPIWVIDFSSSAQWVRKHVVSAAIARCQIFRDTWETNYELIGKQILEDQESLLPNRSVFRRVKEDADTAEGKSLSHHRLPADFFHSLNKLAKHSILGLWILSMFFCFLYQSLAAWRFRKEVQRESYRSGIWQTKTDRLALQLGLSHPPRVLLTRQRISPMLWGIGSRAQILLPDRLLEQLDRRAQHGLILHELSHYQRGDHWVRLFEALACVVYWWHPVFWWIRYETSKAEEQCCDAMAIQHTAGDRRSYAEALLKTIDFVSERRRYRPMTSLAVCLGLLRIRLRKIMCKRQPKSAPNCSSTPWLGAAFCLALLPFPWLSLPDNGSLTASPLPTRSSTTGTAVGAVTFDEPQPNVRPLGSNDSVQAVLTTDSQQRSVLLASSGATVDLGVGTVAGATWTTDRSRLAIGTTDGHVRIFCTESGRSEFQLERRTSAIDQLQFSPCGKALAFANRVGEISVVSLRTGENVLRIRKRNACDTKIAFGSSDALTVTWTSQGRNFSQSLPLIVGSADET